MKVLITITTLIIVMSISSFGQISPKDSKEKEQVAALTREFAEALVKGDTDTLERILSPDYGEVLADSFPESKKMLIEYFKVNKNTKRGTLLKAIDIQTDNLNVRVYDNTAIVGVLATAKWLGANDQIVEQSFLATLAAIKKDGRWQFVVGHASQTPKVQISKPLPNN